MSQTGHDQIGWKFKGEKWNISNKTASKRIKINIYLIEYVTKTLVKNK